MSGDRCGGSPRHSRAGGNLSPQARLAVRWLCMCALLCGANLQTLLAADVELPRERVDISAPATSGKLIQVRAGDTLQAALDRAAPGDIIELDAGAVYTGPFVLPNKPGAAWITIRTVQPAHSTLPPPGVRVQPEHAPAMATLESASGAVLTAASGAHHYRFSGVEIRPATSGSWRNWLGNERPDVFRYGLVVLGEYPDAPEDVPHHFIFERCYLHGDPEIGARRGIAMNSAHTAVVDSWLADFKAEGEDAQALIGWSGPGPHLIANNYVEAAGENLLYGGGDPAIHDLVPADIEIRGNHFAKPLAWKAGDPDFHTTSWTVKNLFELKNARRVLIDGNLFEYNWPQSQNGFAILFTVRNQDGTAPWSTVEDVTFSNNIVRHVANGINILGHDDINTSAPTRRIAITNNLFDDLGGDWGEGTLLQMLEAADDIAFTHNTALSTGKIVQADGRPSGGLVFRDNIVVHNTYGIIGGGTGVGMGTIEHFFSDAVITDNAIVGGRRSNYPAGNAFPLTLQDVGFINMDAGDFRLREDSDHEGRGADFARLCAALSSTDRPGWCR